MNREQIIQMAREAKIGWLERAEGISEFLEAFAKLVAEHEREACANACISLANKWSQMGAWGSNTEFHQCADVIRARGNVATNDTSQERVDEAVKQRHEPCGLECDCTDVCKQDNYKALWQQMCERCDELDKQLAQQAEPIGASEETQRFAIQVEKLLCEKLGRKWSPSGISIQTLVDELADRKAQQAEPDYYGLTKDHLWMSITKDHYNRLKPEFRMACYTSPPLRQPLTDEEIKQIWLNGKDHGDDWLDVQAIARAIEAAVWEKQK